MATSIEKEMRDTKVRAQVDIDRGLWRRFKAKAARRGETLAARLSSIIERDVEGSSRRVTP